ncbi:UNVERIFIED_CONTAM: hypothetical protein FKN15_055936 [Acipenser sinensis]
MNRAKYREVLEENLLPSARKLNLGQKFTFQHENDPKHNPNLWHDLKIAVHQRSPRNLTELEQICKEEWSNIAKSRCGKLVETYPNRLTTVIAAKGASTKY